MRSMGRFNMYSEIPIALSVTLSQRAPESLYHIAYSVTRHTERSVDVGGVILCASGVIEFKIEGDISLNAQLRKSSLDDLGEVVSRATWSSQSSLSRFVIKPDSNRF